MNPRASLLSLAALALVSIGTARAEEPKEIKDPAALLPAHTLVYGELWQPGRLIQEINGLLKDSALEDVPTAVARYRQKAGVKDDQRLSVPATAATGLMFSPELMAEYGRVQGMAGALTGFNSDGEPVGVFVVLPGDSLWIGLMTRAVLSFSDDMTSAGEVEGVVLFKSKGLAVPGVNPPLPPPRATGRQAPPRKVQARKVPPRRSPPRNSPRSSP
jgi:hypothetical protein